MSTDPSGAVTGRVDAAAADSRHRFAAVSARDLAEIATAIKRIEALIGADATPSPENSDALERIADIAFVLHERDVEASLCDALDAAVRKIGGAAALKQASAQRARQAAELLRGVSRRVEDLMARSQAGPPPAASALAARSESDSEAGGEQIGEQAVDEHTAHDGLFEAELREDDEFAQAVAALAESLPSQAETLQLVSRPDLFEPGRLAVGHGAAEDTGYPDVEREHVIDMLRDANQQNVADAGDRTSAARDEVRTTVGAQSPSAPPAPSPEPPAAMGPEDDPGDLFEPSEGAPLAASPLSKLPATNLDQTRAPSGGSAGELGAGAQPDLSDAGTVNTSELSALDAVARALFPSAAPKATPPTALAPLPQRRADSETRSRAVPGPAPSDPLAPLRALSEEETIALFF